MLSVAVDGAKALHFIMPGLYGKTPVFWKPDCIAAVVIDLCQASQNTTQKSCFVILQPTFLNKYSISELFQAVLKLANGVLSRGCSTCDVCEGIAKTSVLFLTINLMNLIVNVALVSIQQEQILSVKSLMMVQVGHPLYGIFIKYGLVYVPLH